MPPPPPPRPVPLPRAAIAFTRTHKKSLFGVTMVGSFVPGLTKKAFAKYGFSTATLITDWPAIAGQELARCTAPERLKWPRHVDRSVEDEAATPQGRAAARTPGRTEGGTEGRTEGRAQEGRTEGRAKGHTPGPSGATLVLRVEGARALDVQYQARQIIDRINGYFGYAAVAELRLLQAPVAAMERPVPGGAVAAQAAHQAALAVAAAASAAEVAGIADVGLRHALARLAVGVRSSR